MGYTHYWSLPTTKKAQAHYKRQWLVLMRWTEAVLAEIQRRGVELRRDRYDAGTSPEVSLYEIRFNGAGEDGHEYLSLPGDPRAYIDSWLAWRRERGWVDVGARDCAGQFCKTDRKPYDAAVCAVLAIALDLGMLTVGSDGKPPGTPEWPEWSNGEELLRAVGYDTARNHTLSGGKEKPIVWIAKED